MYIYIVYIYIIYIYTIYIYIHIHPIYSGKYYGFNMFQHVSSIFHGFSSWWTPGSWQTVAPLDVALPQLPLAAWGRQSWGNNGLVTWWFGKFGTWLLWLSIQLGIIWNNYIDLYLGIMKTLFFIGNFIIPTDELIFFRGVGWNYQPVVEQIMGWNDGTSKKYVLYGIVCS